MGRVGVLGVVRTFGSPAAPDGRERLAKHRLGAAGGLYCHYRILRMADLFFWTNIPLPRLGVIKTRSDHPFSAGDTGQWEAPCSLRRRFDYHLPCLAADFGRL